MCLRMRQSAAGGRGGTASGWARAPVLLLAAGLVLLPAPGRTPPAHAREEAAGLDLLREEQGPLALAEEEPAGADPHDLPCAECHAPQPSGPPGGPLATGDDTVALCLGCHSRSNLHPVGIPVGAGMDPESRGIPLGKGAKEGTITCLTCHYLHRERGRLTRRLLRSVDEAAAGRIQSLCAVCHGSRLKEKSPHLADGGTCSLCHLSEPDRDGGSAPVTSDVQATCNFCHDALANRHFLELNPFNDEYLSVDPAAIGIPLLGGRFTCVSCHDPHAPGGARTKLLRGPYLALAGISKKINPHWKAVMCVACHEGEPRRGEPMLREGGDYVRLCYRCHAFRYSRSDIHPVNVLPSPSVTIPAGMPLHGGRVTCGTCHDSSLQEGAERRDSARRGNPKFLRGGFTNRNEFCFRCHAGGLKGRLNPHEQLDAGGERMPIKCLFCHTSLPEETAGWLVRQRQFDEETVNSLCFLCHPAGRTSSHPMGPHLGRPSREVLEALETAEERLGIPFPLIDGAVVCITCHNPHQEGVLADAAGAPLRGAQRLRAGGEICEGCHPPAPAR